MLDQVISSGKMGYLNDILLILTLLELSGILDSSAWLPLPRHDLLFSLRGVPEEEGDEEVLQRDRRPGLLHRLCKDYSFPF